MKILVLYHSSVFDKKPGADRHIYYTSSMLSTMHDVTLVTWGQGKSRMEQNGNLKIIHFGDNSTRENSTKKLHLTTFMIESLSYFGINYILFLRNKGPTYEDISMKVDTDFDVAIRVSFNKNQIPLVLQQKQNIPVIELALVSGLPHYVNYLPEWMKFINHKSIYQLKIANILYKMFRLIVSKLYISTLASSSVIAVSISDEAQFKARGLKNAKFLPELYYFDAPKAFQNYGSYVLFYSNNYVGASIAVLLIAKIAAKLKDIQFIITGINNISVISQKIPDNIKFTGYLPEDEFRETVQESALIILPLISGTGIQTKMLEALFMGKAIITTSVIAGEFPNLVNGREVIIEDHPENFITHIQTLMKDRKFREYLGKNAREYYNKNFAPEIALNFLEDYIEEIVRKS